MVANEIKNLWRVILGIIVSIIILSILIWVGYKLAWTGFSTKTLWDWMQILVIPAVLAGGAYWLNESARKREQSVTEQRADTELNIASDNRQEIALQTYLDKMTELLLDKKLRESKVESEVRAVARARTLTVLRRLGKDRKGVLLRFLYEADLIDKNNKVIDLSEANLSEADLSNAFLSEADLSKANLSEADLSNAFLSEADLSWINLSEANLSEADLSKTNLRGADLTGAHLSYANLSEAHLRGADLSEAYLTGANLIEADLIGAKYTKNAKDIIGTIWPDGFDLSETGAICVNE